MTDPLALDPVLAPGDRSTDAGAVYAGAHACS